MAFDKFHCFECGGTHDYGQSCPTRTPKVVELPKPKRHLRVVHKTTLGQLGALFFDVAIVEDNFSLPTYVQAVRAAGYILNEHVYIPLEEIASMFVWTEDKPPQPMNVVPFDGGKK